MSTAATKSSNDLAFDLYRRLRASEGNFFFSPLSISSALSMTWAGARGNTAAEMAKALRIDLPQEKFHDAMEALLKELNGRVHRGQWSEDPDKGRKAFELVIANALWTQQGYPFRREFFDRVARSYGAGLTELDFRASVEAARKTINAWVEDRTNRRIQDLIAEGRLPADSRLVLTNAIYFKAAWAETFRKEATKDEDFHLAGGATVKAPIMHRNGHYGYLDEGSFFAIELPYLSEQASLVALVPKKPDGLAALEERLTAGDMEKWIGLLKPQLVSLGFPKFKTTSTFDLSAELQALGMKDAFQFPAADFTGMSDSRELFIGMVLHKAFVDLNEEGTEAAAATAVLMRAGGAPREPLRVQVDRPFVFVIRDVKTGTVLFAGRIRDPR